MPNEALQKKRKSGHRKFIHQRRRNLFLRNQSVAISTTTAAASTAATGTVRPTCTAATARAAPLTPATTAATCARLLGTCFIDGQGTTFNTLSVERSNCCLRFLIGAHFDKAETFGALRFTIGDHLCRSNRAVRGKHLLQIILFHVVAQVAYV